MNALTKSDLLNFYTIRNPQYLDDLSGYITYSSMVSTSSELFDALSSVLEDDKLSNQDKISQINNQIQDKESLIFKSQKEWESQFPNLKKFKNDEIENDEAYNELEVKYKNFQRALKSGIFLE